MELVKNLTPHGRRVCCLGWCRPARGGQEYGFNTFSDWETQLCVL